MAYTFNPFTGTFDKVQNGYELDEIHDVLITNPISTQVLQLSSNGVQFLWVNNNIDKTHVTGYENWDSVYSTVQANSASQIKTNTSDVTPVYTIRAITQVEYDAILVKDPNTLYFIV